MRLVPDQHPIEQLVAAGLDPPFHERVRAGNPDTAEHDGDTGVGEDGVEQGRVPSIAVTDQVFHLASGVVEVDDEVACGLAYPHRGRVSGSTEDANPAGRVLDDREDVHAGAG